MAFPPLYISIVPVVVRIVKRSQAEIIFSPSIDGNAAEVLSFLLDIYAGLMQERQDYFHESK